MANSYLLQYFSIFLVLCLLNSARSDFAADRAECQDQLLGLATCITFVEGSSKYPTPDCCTGLKAVVSKSIKCLCILIRDRNEPALGFKANATIAASLPSKCNAPAKVSDCPRVLKLPPNSAEAKDFNQLESIVENTSSSRNVKANPTDSGVTSTSKPTPKSDVSTYSRGERLLGVDRVVGFVFLTMLLVL